MGDELDTVTSGAGDAEPSGRAGRSRPRDPETVGYAALLVTVLVSFAIQGVATPSAWEQVFVTILLGMTFMLALWLVHPRPHAYRAALVIVTATITLSVVEAANGVVDGRATRVANALLVGLAPPAVVLGVARNLRAKQRVTIDAVLGVISVYVLLGMAFAFVYGAIDHVGGSPFFAQHEPATVSHCLYFSFTTLATVGYGDFTARTNLGHTLSVSEALVGQIYLVTIVSLIVSNLGRRREPSVSQAQ
jgi:hypothetical protein